MTRALAPYQAFKIHHKARDRDGFAAGVKSAHPSETARAIALCDSCEWGEEAAIEHAELFAAAPELLEACETALANLEPDYCSEHLVMKRLRSAIAKAKGE